MDKLLAQLRVPSGSDANPGSIDVPFPAGFRFQKLADIFKTAGSAPGLIALAFVAAGFGLLIMLIAAGMTYLTSAGDPKKMETAKNRLTYAVIGFLIIFTAFWIVQIAGVVFGIPDIGDIFR